MSVDRYPHAFSPLRVGTMDLDQRLVVTPHGGGNGNLVGTDAEYEQLVALWLAKLAGGMQWLGGSTHFVRNPRLPAGFEVVGVGSSAAGSFRHPAYVERLTRFVDQVHAGNGFLSAQVVLQGGMPVAPSSTTSSYLEHSIPHALHDDEVHWLIQEFAESSRLALSAGIDAIEIHANHDDLVQWFLSPLTNRRTDGYGGSFENRRRFLREICEGIRAATGRPFTLGLRLCIDEMIDGGYGLDDCQRLLAAFTADGTVDYFSLDVGSNWGNPSYLPIPWHDDASWAPLCGEAKTATNLPVVYAGRVLDVATAETILANGWADAVGMVRATIADPAIVAKTRRGEEAEVRPCIGLNDCVHRKVVEGLPHACGVNPSFARERELPPVRAAGSKRVVIVGGGPAGSELAALCAERGHRVQLWDRRERLGGLLNVAGLARGNRTYLQFGEFQARRLAALEVELRLGVEATADALLAEDADVIALATGATPRRPAYPGVDLAHVVTAADALTGAVELGRRIVVISEDDGPAPLSVTDHLCGLGHEMTFVYQGPTPSPGVGKYSHGSMFGRLQDGGVRFVPMTRAIGFEAGRAHLADSYGSRRWTLECDTVVLVCGGVPNDSLARELAGRHPYVRILGDAYAPRRVVYATRQAWALAAEIDQIPDPVAED
ncbi:MAG: FAD-dependent oxidoreductase [Ilumatobacteraceae bacterium]